MSGDEKEVAHCETHVFETEFTLGSAVSSGKSCDVGTCRVAGLLGRRVNADPASEKRDTELPPDVKTNGDTAMCRKFDLETHSMVVVVSGSVLVERAAPEDVKVGTELVWWVGVGCTAVSVLMYLC